MKIELNKADVAQLKIMLSGVKNGAPKVLTRAINETLKGTRTAAKKEIAKYYNLTQKRINQDFTTNKANWTKLSGSVVAKGKPIGLLSYAFKKSPKGLRGKILRENATKVILGAFITRAGIASASTGEKPLGAFRRAGKKRYPIHRLTGPRIEDEFAKDRTYDVVTDYAQDQIGKQAGYELDRELSKL